MLCCNAFLSLSKSSLSCLHGTKPSTAFVKLAAGWLTLPWRSARAQEAHVNGLACVIACAQQEAEEYCERLRLNGLMVTLEPAGSGGNGSPDAC